MRAALVRPICRARHLADVGDAHRRLAPELVLERGADLVGVGRLEILVDGRRDAAPGRHQRAELLRAVVEPIAVQVVELVDPVVLAAGVAVVGEHGRQLVVETAPERLDYGLAAAEGVVDADARRDVVLRCERASLGLAGRENVAQNRRALAGLVEAALPVVAEAGQEREVASVGLQRSWRNAVMISLRLSGPVQVVVEIVARADVDELDLVGQAGDDRGSGSAPSCR